MVKVSPYLIMRREQFVLVRIWFPRELVIVRGWLDVNHVRETMEGVLLTNIAFAARLAVFIPGASDSRVFS